MDHALIFMYTTAGVKTNKLFIITLANANPFTKFFHHKIPAKVFNNYGKHEPIFKTLMPTDSKGNL